MTDQEFRQVDIDRERATQDAVLAALNLNAALKNFKKAGGDLLANRVWLRLLDDTETFLNQEGVKTS